MHRPISERRPPALRWKTLPFALALAIAACGDTKSPAADPSPRDDGDTETGPDGGKINPRDGGKDIPGRDGGRDATSSGGGDSGGTPSECLATTPDDVPASIDPPAGLAPSKVPQFVMFGFDDNAYADGMSWVVDSLFAGRKNADGSPALATFFLIGGAGTSKDGGVFNSAGGQTEAQVIASWRKAYDAGHEIGNHTWDHADGGDARDLAEWKTEITKSTDFIASSLGIDKCQIVGWRYPYLHFDDAGFQALQPAGYRYDTSVEFGYNWWQPPGMSSGFGNTSPENGKHYWWPFTLDHGFDASFSNLSKGVGVHPGMWEFPVHAFNRPDPDDAKLVKTVTGLDYNLWTARSSDPKVDFCGTLKYSVDQRYKSNRSPFNVGMHSDLYSQYNAVADGAFTDKYAARRAALKCFLDYVLTLPDVRVVSFKTVIEWMRNPKPLH
jgi:hypothetical protein